MEWGLQTPHGMLVVREAVDSDASALARLHRAVIAEDRYFITRTSELRGGPDSALALVRALARADNSLFLAAFLDGALVGRLTLQGGGLKRLAHNARLEVMVANELRGIGVGAALMRAAIDWGNASAVVEKISLSVFSDNTRAVAMYRHFGFEVEGERRGEYRMEDGSYRDDLLMFRWVLDTPRGAG